MPPEKQVMVTHPDIVIVEKVDKKVVVIDVAVANGINVGKKNREKLEQ